MPSSILVFVGSELSDTNEKCFLARLCSDLELRVENALVLANFDAGFPGGSKLRQIDFLVVLPQRAVWHIELKCWSECPMRGGLNGYWERQVSNGSWSIVNHLPNPWQQAVAGSLAISDDMRRFAEKHLRSPDGGGFQSFLKSINGVACFYPRLHSGSKVCDNFKARVWGYDRWLEELPHGTTSTTWAIDDWMKFIAFMNLVPSNSDGTIVSDNRMSESALEAARTAFEDYLRSETTAELLAQLSDDLDFASGVRKGAFQAFESLPEVSQIKLIHMARPRPDTTLFILRHFGWIDRPEIAIQILQEIATEPIDDPFPGDWFSPIQSFVESWVECARLMESPPLPKTYFNDSHRAWQLFGQILFWLRRSQSGSQTLAESDRLWEVLYRDFPFEAADCLWRIGTADSSTDTHRRDWFPLREFIEMFASPMRRILIFGINNYHQLPRQNDIDELDMRRLEFMVSTLGYVGDEATEEYLSKVTDLNVRSIAKCSINLINAARQRADISTMYPPRILPGTDPLSSGA